MHAKLDSDALKAFQNVLCMETLTLPETLVEGRSRSGCSTELIKFSCEALRAEEWFLSVTAQFSSSCGYPKGAFCAASGCVSLILRASAAYQAPLRDVEESLCFHTAACCGLCWVFP